MLARNRFDPEALVRVVNAVQLRVGFQPLQPLGETDIEVNKISTYEEMVRIFLTFLEEFLERF